MPKRKSKDSRSTKASKRARVTPNPLPQLPQEILEQIFLNLNFTDLLRARKTCRRWRDAIGSCPGLRDKFRLKFPHDRKITSITGNYKPPGTVPASNVVFRLYNYSKIGSINAWWPQVASTVTCLVMSGCEFPVDVLQHVPKLKSLELNSARIGGSDRVEFKLNSLMRLSLKNSRPGPLARMITRLEALKCVIDDFDDSEYGVIVELIQSAKSSLKELVLDTPRYYLRVFSLLTELRLQKVHLVVHSFCISCEADVVSFVQAHQSIEDLTIVNSLNDDDLRNVLQAPTNLKRLKLKYVGATNNNYDVIEPLEMPMIPNVLSNLENLIINCEENYNPLPLHFQRECYLPKLQELVISSVILEGESLRRSLRSSPNLNSMILKRCEFKSWDQLFRLVTQPQSLRSLTLMDFKFMEVVNSYYDTEDEDEGEPIPINPCKTLRFLRICDTDKVPTDKVLALFPLFPHLTELVLDLYVDDKLVKEACRTLTRLERLTVGEGSTVTVTYIRRYCRNLKHLTLLGDCKLKKADKHYLKQNMVSFRRRSFDEPRFDNDS